MQTNLIVRFKVQSNQLKFISYIVDRISYAFWTPEEPSTKTRWFSFLFRRRSYLANPRRMRELLALSISAHNTNLEEVSLMTQAAQQISRWIDPLQRSKQMEFRLWTRIETSWERIAFLEQPACWLPACGALHKIWLSHRFHDCLRHLGKVFLLWNSRNYSIFACNHRKFTWKVCGRWWSYRRGRCCCGFLWQWATDPNFVIFPKWIHAFDNKLPVLIRYWFLKKQVIQDTAVSERFVRSIQAVWR